MKTINEYAVPVIIATAMLFIWPWSSNVFTLPKMFVIAAVVVAVMCVRGRVCKTDLDLPYSVVALCFLISLLRSRDLAYSFLGHDLYWTYGLLALFLYAGVYKVSMLSFDWPTRYMVMFSIPMMTWAVLEKLGVGTQFNMWIEYTGRMSSTQGSPLWLAQSIALAAPFFYARYHDQKPWLLASIFLILAASISTGSRCAFLGIGAGAAAYLWNVRRSSRPLILIGMLVGAVVTIKWLIDGNFKPTDVERIETYRIALKAWWNGPSIWWGFGPDNFILAFRQFRDARYNMLVQGNSVSVQGHAHNLILDILVNMGLCGLASITWLAYRIYSTFRNEEVLFCGFWASIVSVMAIGMVEPLSFSTLVLVSMMIGSYSIVDSFEKNGAWVLSSGVALIMTSLMFVSSIAHYHGLQSVADYDPEWGITWFTLSRWLNPTSMENYLFLKGDLKIHGFGCTASAWHPDDPQALQMCADDYMDDRDYKTAKTYVDRASYYDPTFFGIKQQAAEIKGKL